MVAAFWERVRIHTVTIVPGEGYEGRVHHSDLLKGHHPDADAGPSNRFRMERLVRVALAGHAAQRRYDPRSRFRARSDYDHAADLVTHFTHSGRHTEAYLHLLQVEAEELLNRPGVWPQVEAVAAALLLERTIGQRRLYRILRQTQSAWLNAELGRRTAPAAGPSADAGDAP